MKLLERKFKKAPVELMKVNVQKHADISIDSRYLEYSLSRKKISSTQLYIETKNYIWYLRHFSRSLGVPDIESALRKQFKNIFKAIGI